MLMGLDFFRRVTDFQQKHGRAGTRIANGIQTNATLIDDAAAEHFARYRFLIGCSLDGPVQMHDRYFDSILQKLIDGSCNICTLGNNCCQYFVVEYNGDIYPCDFFLEKT